MTDKDSPSAETETLQAASETSQPGDSPPSKPTQEPQMNPAQARKFAVAEAKIAKLEEQLRDVEEKQREVDEKLQTKDPQALVNDHIRQLHRYNEIRDVGQGLMGIIAEQRGVRVIEVYKEFGIEEGD